MTPGPPGPLIGVWFAIYEVETGEPSLLTMEKVALPGVPAVFPDAELALGLEVVELLEGFVPELIVGALDEALLVEFMLGWL